MLGSPINHVCKGFHKGEKPMLQPNQKLVFAGDSITDAYRDYGNPNNLGLGYVNMLNYFLQLKFPQLRLQVFNRGINGHRLIDMKRRWQENCLDFQPDWVSILIGINDIWTHHHQYKNIGMAYWHNFYNNYDSLIAQTKNQGAQVVLMKVFVLPYPQERLNWQADVFIMNQLIDQLAKQHQCPTVELQGPLLSLGREYGFALYTGSDGVHPTPLGHGVIAQNWLKALGYF